MAVPPLVPWLRRARVERFAEPCCGDRSLISHLETAGLRCCYAGDIAEGRDALRWRGCAKLDAIITNPPYDRPVMHALILHFQAIAPTWLLIEWDWLATKQARPFLPQCSDAVVVGRLKIIPGSPHMGKENFVWCRFLAGHRGGPRLRVPSSA